MAADHLNENDFLKNFPDDVDEFPTPADNAHYIDAWLVNTAFASLKKIEEYLLAYKANIEAEIGDDIVGADGEAEIPIPPARYPAYKTALAWDSNLLQENIRKDVNVFGVIGTLLAGAGEFPSLGIYTPENIIDETIAIEITHEIT